ncbi:glycosyltransferase family 4 protein, partial [Candidatus Kaiserbacteria bacterium]|nr:glycosyltransferase family 4 protein [Candidatus Kaiserbacteria bacterium]
MKIIIATGIFPPEVGGPAYYSAALRDALEVQGHEVRVVLYGRLKKLPPGVRHLGYFLKLMRHARWAEGIIAFDTFSVGLPAAVAGMLTQRPVVARIGGDFMWEMYTERTKDLIALPQVYEHRERWSAKERSNFRIQRWVIQHVDLAFTCMWMRDIWARVYALDEAHVHVVENALPP